MAHPNFAIHKKKDIFEVSIYPYKTEFYIAMLATVVE